MIALSISLTISIIFQVILMMAIGSLSGKGKKYEELLKSQQLQILNLALALNKTIKNQEDLATEVADAMPNFVTKGEVN